MKTLFTLGLILISGLAFSQVPTNFGSNAEDGITYQTYNLIDHGSVSSVRFQAQNEIAEGDGTWEFYTDNYNQTWRPYDLEDTLIGYDTFVDPIVETSSARYNSFLGGGETGKLPAVQAGYYYTAIVGNNATADNFMSIIETDFNPVVIDTVYNTPTEPTEIDEITITVELYGSLTLNPGEHLFIRAAVNADFTISPAFLEVTNFSNGVGTVTIPAGQISAGITSHYYALVTEEASPVHETIDYFTLFFGNNGGNNYEFTVSSVTGIEDVNADFGIVQANGTITVKNTTDLNAIELISIDGRVVAISFVNGGVASLQTTELTKGIYVLNLIGNDKSQSVKLFVD